MGLGETQSKKMKIDFLRAYYLEKNAGHYGAENTYEEAKEKYILESKFLYKELGME